MIFTIALATGIMTRELPISEALHAALGALGLR
jgi:hypothetical protein